MTESLQILAVGAAGRAAGLVVPELAKRGATVRALVHDAAQTDTVRANGAAQVAVGDLTDRATIDAALVGIDAAFYIAPAFMPDEAETGRQFVEAAASAGVRRLVFSSVLQPCLSALENHRAKVPVEEAILASGMEFVSLHPGMFFQNYQFAWDAIVSHGVLAEPYSPETRFARVDYRDVAEVAAIALTEDRLLYGTFDLCADPNLNRGEVASLISDVLGQPIHLLTPTFEDFGRLTNIARSELEPMKAMFDWYNTHELPGNALALRVILDREPRTLRDYFHELAHRRPPE